MDKRMISFENNLMKKSNQNNITIPTPTKPNNLVKPDFSPILIKQNQFCFKQFGSYKKQKYREPESTMTPIKSPNFKTSEKMEGRNLFGSPQNENLNNCKFFKKLNFDDCCNDKNSFLSRKSNNHENDFFQKNSKLNMFLEKCDEEDEEYFNLNNNKENDNLNHLPSPKFGKEDTDIFMYLNNNEFKPEKRTRRIRKCSINIESNIEILKNGKFENDFSSLKTIKIDKFSTIYKVEEIKTKKIFCVKKLVKTSPKSNIDNLKKIISDFRNNNNNVLNQFCAKIFDFWIEKEEYNALLSEINYCDKNLYLLSNFYENGDIFDYIEKLELLAKEGIFTFTENFYWDIIFEMMMGILFVHECGYMHIDIQPTNFLVDENGYLKLNDFSLSLRVNKLCILDDIIEGDARYISKELFHFKKNSKINSKVDVFSLGLTILEIIAKIDLPYNGNLWHEIRNENFRISNKFFDKSNIRNENDFISLISQMILPFEKRPTIKELINIYPQLSQRYKSLLNGNYKKSCKIPKLKKGSSNSNLNLSSVPSLEKL